MNEKPLNKVLKYLSMTSQLLRVLILQLIFLLLMSLLFVGCGEINTTIPNKAYKYWAGTHASSDLKILKGQYWQSSHWTKEYILYLKLRPTFTWWNEFLKQNHLRIDTTIWTMPSDAPKWFQPSKNFVRFRFYDSGNFDQGSRYFRDTINNDCYIYEIQL